MLFLPCRAKLLALFNFIKQKRKGGFSMEWLRAEYGGYTVYNAGLPYFFRNFSRDSLISGIMASDEDLLRNQLCFCAARQAVTKNPYSGAEPGKIHHDYKSTVEIRGLSVEFNACDTTALFLIGHEVYQSLSNDNSLADTQRANIELAVQYILSHLEEDLFMETPELCGAKMFALKVTYWKDSIILGREQGEPDYPVVYPLAHIINMRGIRSAAKLLNRKDLWEIADRMAYALQKLYDHKLGTFYIAIDSRGPISGVSSDSLHALFYLSPGDLSIDQLKQIVDASIVLETPLGYRTLDPKLTSLIKDDTEKMNNSFAYHRITVWPFEQAVIHMGARRFELKRPMEVSSRIMSWILDSDPEIFILNEDGTIRKGGSDPQLWTIAAKKYFFAEGIS